MENEKTIAMPVSLVQKLAALIGGYDQFGRNVYDLHKSASVEVAPTVQALIDNGHLDPLDKEAAAQGLLDPAKALKYVKKFAEKTDGLTMGKSANLANTPQNAGAPKSDDFFDNAFGFNK